MIFMVLGYIFYFIIDKYVCVYYPCLQKGLIYLTNKEYENNTFDDISGNGIPEVLRNIMFCHGFKNKIVQLSS